MTTRTREDDLDEEPLRISFYGDDFTGSCDVLEALTLSGYRARLLLGDAGTIDSAEMDPQLDAVGLAGMSRAFTPDQMDRHLPAVFRLLGQPGWDVAHYKICSTFDSSPNVGSIGRALEIAKATLQTATIPMIVGAPVLRRFTAFGHLFAGSHTGKEVFRLDRHPTMTRHPITPMDESDLLVHLSRQTDLSVECFTIEDLSASRSEVIARYRRRTAGGPDAILIDVVDENSLAMAGQVLRDQIRRWRGQSDQPLVVFGSSGVEYALSPQDSRERSQVGVEHRVAPPRQGSGYRSERGALVIVGSCADASRRQLDYAISAGWLPLELVTSNGRSSMQRQVLDLVAEASQHVQAGRNVAVFSSPPSPETHVASDLSSRTDPELVGATLAQVAAEVIACSAPACLVVAGGDTSGRVARSLGIRSLAFASTLAPGSPLCRAQGTDRSSEHLLVALKGGQVGEEDYFVRALAEAEKLSS